MKTVFKNNQEVCHIWASRNQESGKSGNLSFVKDRLLSYNWYCIGNFINDNTVLIVNWTYSNSTARHMRYMNRAIPDFYKKIPCYEPYDGYGKIDHKKNIDNYLILIKNSFKSFKTAIKYKSGYFKTNKYEINLLIDYCNLFNLSIPDYDNINLNKPEYLKEIENQEIKLKILEQKRIEKRNRLIENSKDELIKLENSWINGETNKTSLFIDKITRNIEFSQIRLRVNNDIIETSLNANVPIREAKILFERINTGKDIKGFRIGYYTVISINGTLKIGCHNIELSEVYRIAKVLNWI
jgi:hypothetical protein